MNAHDNRSGSDGRRTRVTRPGREAAADRNREERRSERARNSKAFPGTRETEAHRVADDATSAPTMSPELARMLATRPVNLERGEPKDAGAFAKETIMPNLGGLRQNARNAKYEFLVGVFKVASLLRHLQRDPVRERAVRRALKLERRKTVYLELLYAFDPPPPEDESGERKRVMDRYSDYNCALMAAEEEGLRPDALLARLLEDQGVQKLVEGSRAKKRQETAGDGDGDMPDRQPEDRSSVRRRQREEQAAKAAAAGEPGSAAPLLGARTGSRGIDSEGWMRTPGPEGGSTGSEEGEPGLGVVEAKAAALPAVLSHRGKHGAIIVIKGPPGGPVTVKVNALGLMRAHRFTDDQEAVEHMIASVIRSAET